MKVSLTAEQLKRTAVLANVSLPEGGLEGLIGQLEQLLDYVEKLKAFPPGGEEPVGPISIPVGGGKTRPLSQEEVLALAPDSYRGQVRVPRVLPDE